MNKNGEKEGQRSKGQKKGKSLKVNKPKGGDNKVPEDENCGEADDISNKFPNFSLLNAEERLVFYQALTAARKNVERRGVPTRERFGTVHDEYLKYFDHEGKKDERDPNVVSASVTSNTTVPEGSVSLSCELSADQFQDEKPSEEKKSQSPTLLLEGFSEAPSEGPDPVTIESGFLDGQVSDQCESVIQQDTDKMLAMYLDKKKRNEAKFEESRPDGKKPDQGGERKAPNPQKKEIAEHEKKKQQQKRKKRKKESTLAYQVSETQTKKRETPRFDALNAEERDMFFSILQEARNNIVGKNPERKGEILPLDAIAKRYRGDSPATRVYATRVQESRRRCEGKKNLKVKVTLTSGDNERLQKTKSEDLSDTEKKNRRYTPSERQHSEDVDIDHVCENEVETEDPVEKEESNKPNEKPSNQNVREKLQGSSLTIDIKSSPGLKNVRSTGEKMPPMEAKPSETNKKGDGNVKKTYKNQSYYMKVPKSLNEPQKNCSRGRRTANVSKPIKLQKTPSENEEIKQKKKLQEQMETEVLQEPFYEGCLEERVEVEEECAEQEEKGEEEEEQEQEEEEEEEAERSSSNMAKLECQVGSYGKYRMPMGEENREGNYTETCMMQDSSLIVQDSQDSPEDVQKKEEEAKQTEANAQESCFPGDQWGALNRDKQSLMTVKSLFLGDAREGRGGECSGGEAEEEERAEGSLGKDEEEEMKEFSGMPTSAKVMIVDDNVIEKIRKLIYYLEAKAGKDDRLEKEYMKLLVDYVEYLSKVLEALVHKKERRKQVQRAYPAEVSLKFDENRERETAKEGSRFMPRSVSAQEFRNESILAFRKNTPEEKSKVKNESEGISTSMFLSDSDMSLHTMPESPYVQPISSNKKVVATKIRLLQDLLKQRAEFVEGSTDDLKIIHHPQEEYVPEERAPTVKLITEEDEENTNKGHNIKLIRLLIKCFTCGKKKQEEEGIFDNLKGEAVRVDVCEGQSKDPANATLNQSTMEVLKAAGRKRIIDKYYGKN